MTNGAFHHQVAGIPNAHLLLGGDLKLPCLGHAAIVNETEKQGAAHLSLCNKFVDIIHDHGLEQMQTPSTGLRHPSFNHCRI